MDSSSDIRSVMQQLRAERAAQAGAGQVTLVDFINWSFYGQGNSIAVFVTALPLSELKLTQATIALQTPSGLTLCNGLIDSSYPQTGRGFNLFTSSDIFNPSQHGTEVQAYAAIKALVNDVIQVQISPVMTYTVGP